MSSHGSDLDGELFAKEVDLPFCEFNIEALQVEIAGELSSRNYPREGVFAVRLAIEEALETIPSPSAARARARPLLRCVPDRVIEVSKGVCE